MRRRPKSVRPQGNWASIDLKISSGFGLKGPIFTASRVCPVVDSNYTRYNRQRIIFILAISFLASLFLGKLDMTRQNCASHASACRKFFIK